MAENIIIQKNGLTEAEVDAKIAEIKQYSDEEIEDVLDRIRNNDSDSIGDNMLDPVYGSANVIDISGFENGTYKIGQMVWDSVGTGGIIESVSVDGDGKEISMTVKTTVTNPDEKAKCLKTLNDVVGGTTDLLTTDFDPSDRLRVGMTVWSADGVVGYISAMGANFAVTVTTITASSVSSLAELENRVTILEQNGGGNEFIKVVDKPVSFYDMAITAYQEYTPDMTSDDPRWTRFDVGGKSILLTPSTDYKLSLSIPDILGMSIFDDGSYVFHFIVEMDGKGNDDFFIYADTTGQRAEIIYHHNGVNYLYNDNFVDGGPDGWSAYGSNPITFEDGAKMRCLIDQSSFIPLYYYAPVMVEQLEYLKSHDNVWGLDLAVLDIPGNKTLEVGSQEYQMNIQSDPNKQVLLNGVPLPVGQPGPKGASGDTPYIGDNGNWWVNGVDTGKPSQGEAGPPANLNERGLYDPAATYNEDDVVVFMDYGNSYIARVDGLVGVAPTNEMGDANWALFVMRGPAGIKGQDGIMTSADPTTLTMIQTLPLQSFEVVADQRITWIADEDCFVQGISRGYWNYVKDLPESDDIFIIVSLLVNNVEVRAVYTRVSDLSCAAVLEPYFVVEGTRVDFVFHTWGNSLIKTGSVVWPSSANNAIVLNKASALAIQAGIKTITEIITEVPDYENASVLKTLTDGFFPKTFAPGSLSYRGSAPGFAGDEFIVPEDGFYAIEYGTAGSTLQGRQVLTCITVNKALEVSDYRIISEGDLVDYAYLSTGYKRRNKGDILQMTASVDQYAENVNIDTTLSGRTCLLYAPIKRVPLSAATMTYAELTQLIADGKAVVGQIYYVTDTNTANQTGVPTPIMIKPDGTPEYVVMSSELDSAISKVNSTIETHIGSDAALYQNIYKAIMSEVQDEMAGNVPVYDMKNPEVVLDKAGALIAVDLGKTWTAPSGGKLVMIYKAQLLGVSPVVTKTNGEGTKTIFSDGLGIIGLTNGEPVTERITVGDVIDISGSLGLLTSFNATFYPSL